MPSVYSPVGYLVRHMNAPQTTHGKAAARCGAPDLAASKQSTDLVHEQCRLILLQSTCDERQVVSGPAIYQSCKLQEVKGPGHPTQVLLTHELVVSGMPICAVENPSCYIALVHRLVRLLAAPICLIHTARYHFICAASNPYPKRRNAV